MDEISKQLGKSRKGEGQGATQEIDATGAVQRKQLRIWQLFVDPWTLDFQESYNKILISREST
jgi:hypothetical protein